MHLQSTSCLAFDFSEEQEETFLLAVTGGRTIPLGRHGFSAGQEVVAYAGVTDDVWSREFLGSKTWCRNKWGYVITNLPRPHIGKTVMFLHQYVFDHYYGSVPEGLTIDHIDRNKLNNKASNLRLATEGFQKANQSIRRDNSSGYRGVCWDKNRKLWMARVKVAKKVLNLGRFSNIRDAAQAVNDAYAQHYPSIPAPNIIT